jgi:hypothetical protein
MKGATINGVTYEEVAEFMYLGTLISNDNNVVCFLLGNSPASEFYMPTFRNTLFHLPRQVG